MNIYLYKVENNLNRCIRTAYSFGIDRLYIVKCKRVIKGNLFSAKGKVEIIESELPNPEETIVMEFDANCEVKDIQLKDFKNMIIGGESVNLSSKMGKKVKINTINRFCLTTEATLAIVLNKLING